MPAFFARAAVSSLSVIHTQQSLLCREKSHIICQELSYCKGIKCISSSNKAIADSSHFKEKIGKAFDKVVIFSFVSGYYLLCVFTVKTCEFADSTQEFACFKCTDRKNGIMQIRCSKFLFKELQF